MQQRSVDLALDQVVLGACPHRCRAEMLVGQAGEDDHGHRNRVLLQPAQAVQAVRVGQAEIQQGAGDAG